MLASMVDPGASVLDLGTGSGALGRHLGERLGCIVDGVTYNEAEAVLARPHYRRVEVADLDTCDLATLFPGCRYDFIVCADVLEHLRQPERILGACRTLLAPTGRVLISVPNAGYAGLVAELMGGEFRYRDEGLLDRTHLRFFTRRSLQRFLAEAGWVANSIDVVEVDLAASEFRVAFDSLPPAVARHLIASPDASSYQFIVAARPSDSAAAETPAAGRDQAPARAQFTAELFLRTTEGYTEQGKLVARGIIGDLRQTLRFDLPRATPPLCGLRLDPADRPGFFHLHAIRLLDADGNPLWAWHSEEDSIDALASAPHHDIVFRPPWPLSQAALLMLHGDDPWVELPVAAALAGCARGGALEIDAGWPMSADYLALADAGREFAREIAARDAQVAEARAQAASLSARTAQELLELERLRASFEAVSEQRDTLMQRQAALKKEVRKAEQARDGLVQHLQSIENSTVFRATRPLVKLKMRLDRAIGGAASEAQESPGLSPPEARRIAPSSAPVDVIVPVYRGLGDTRRCIESVLHSVNQTPFRLIIINDASPEAEVTDWLRQLDGSDERIVLLENEHNLGFVATVNRGMAMSTSNDVVLLNSDAEVANDWLDRIRGAAYADARVASVTPFSNNATICSYPRFCADNELPAGYDTATLDALFAQVNAGQIVDIPTAIGFCMYIRRDCLAEIGPFDVDNFGKGYGEENDFCMRASEAGWRNVFALDTFVRHAGGVSFGASKTPREREAGAVMRRLHPEYETLVHTHIAADPARSSRLAVDLARVRASELPVILVVAHDRAGGTRRHIEELAERFGRRAAFFTLSPAPGGETLLEYLGAGEALQLAFRLPDEFDALVDALRRIGTSHVHFHHLLGHTAEVRSLPERLGVRYDFTAHDFYAICPQVSLIDHTNRYCGEEGLDQCRACLRRSPAPGGVEIETWRDAYRDLIEEARVTLAPSHDTARRLRELAPGGNIHVAPHAELYAASIAPPRPARLVAEGPLRIAVIGALSPIKGADILEDVAAEAARQDKALEFHLVGYAYRNLRTQPRTRLTVHGPYDDHDLGRLLDWLKPDLVWFPAQCPETYSYTLSACLRHGLPVVATNLGAFPERLAGREWSWIRPWNMKPAEWLAFFDKIRSEHFVSGEGPNPVAADPGPADDWTYDEHYLQGIVSASAQEPLTRAFLDQHRPGRHVGIDAVRKGAKNRALKAIVRLRSAPVLRGVARRIPLRWQSRLKSWLQR